MSVSIAALAGKYALTKVSGQAPGTPGPVMMDLQTDPSDPTKLRLHAKVANSMNGTVSLEGDKLKGFLMSTRMMGPPPLMTVERLLGSGLMDGMSYTLEGKVLTMTGQTGSLEWTME